MICFAEFLRVLTLIGVAAAPLACASVDENRSIASIEREEAPRLTLAPLSYVAFCREHDQECGVSGAPNAIIPLTPESRAMLQSVNRQVNERIRPTNAIGNWRINPDTGNCNDYVVSKRHELLSRGMPASALLITVAQTAAGEDHLLLTVRTDHGELVLDNLTNDILPRPQTTFVWLKRQRPSDPATWEEL